jgi:hypothetical protein
MKYAHKATEHLRIVKGYPTTISERSIEFERYLKPFKRDVSGDVGREFTRFEGGTENA